MIREKVLRSIQMQAVSSGVGDECLVVSLPFTEGIVLGICSGQCYAPARTKRTVASYTEMWSRIDEVGHPTSLPWYQGLRNHSDICHKYRVPKSQPTTPKYPLLYVQTLDSSVWWFSIMVSQKSAKYTRSIRSIDGSALESILERCQEMRTKRCCICNSRFGKPCNLRRHLLTHVSKGTEEGVYALMF